MPEEGIQWYIGCVGYGKIIAHLVSSQDLGVAPLGNGDAQTGGLVIGTDLDDLARIFQGNIVDRGV